MKIAKDKKIGDFSVTIEIVDKATSTAQVKIDHANEGITFTAELFWIDKSSYEPGGEAHLHTDFKGKTPYTIEVHMRSEEYHMRINSPEAKGGIESIIWK